MDIFTILYGSMLVDLGNKTPKKLINGFNYMALDDFMWLE